MSYKVTIKTNGQISFGDVKGYGSNCQEATKKLEELLGHSDESTRTLTDEYHENQESTLEQANE